MGVLGVFVLLAAVVQIFLEFVIRHRKAEVSDSLDARILTTVRGPAVLFVVVLGMYLSFQVLTGITDPAFDLLVGWGDRADKAWRVVVIIQVAYLASHLLQELLGWYIRLIADRTTPGVEAKLLPPIRRILPITIYAIATLITLDSLDVSISPLLAGFGLGGLAVALAVQPTLSNFFAGTYLVTEGEVKIGDYIEIDGGPAGFVVDVGWRSVKIRSRFNNLIIVPNSKMSDSIVTNYFSPTPAMNVIVTSGVAYESDLAHVERVVLEVAEAVVKDSPYAVTDNEPFFGFSEFGDSNIDFWVFVQAYDRTGSFILKSELIKRIHARFVEEGIEINYPVRKLIAPPGDNNVPAIEAHES